MMIDHRLPENWRDLQDKVAEIFNEIGHVTEIEYTISTVRGQAKIDVYSVDQSQSPNIVYLCECKYWDTNIPQSVIREFRTIVQDYGANFGLIISKKEYQSGAYEAVKNTNVILLNWFSFQDMFEVKWFIGITDKLYEKYDDLIPYTEPLIGFALDKKLDRLSQDKVEEFLNLREKYRKIGMEILHLKFSGRYDYQLRIKFPHKLPIPTDQKTPEIKELHSFREYFSFLDIWAEKALREIEIVLAT